MHHKIKIMMPKNLEFMVPNSPDGESGKARKSGHLTTANVPNEADQGSGEGGQQSRKDSKGKSPPIQIRFF